jgi:hypothetical protein
MTIDDDAGVVTGQEYGLHVVLDREMQSVLKNSAELAYRLGDIPKPSLVSLINLFIGYGLIILKKKWLDRVGYK